MLEVILALALMSLLLVGVLSFQWMLMDRRATLMARADEAEGVSLLVQRLEADLLAATAGDGRGGAGVKGDGRGVRIHARGVWLAGPSASERREASDEPSGGGAGTGQAILSRSAAGDLMGTEVRWEPAGVGGGRLVMTRWLMDGGEEVSRGSTVLAEGVRGFRLRYFDGRAWSDRFDSAEAGGLPAAVEVCVWTGRGAAVGGDGTDLIAASGAGAINVNSAEVPGDSPTRVRVMAVPDGGVKRDDARSTEIDDSRAGAGVMR